MEATHSEASTSNYLAARDGRGQISKATHKKAITEVDVVLSGANKTVQDWGGFGVKWSRVEKSPGKLLHQDSDASGASAAGVLVENR